MTPRKEHNWNPHEGGATCLACGCSMFNWAGEPTLSMLKDCPGRTPQFQAERDAMMARLSGGLRHKNTGV